MAGHATFNSSSSKKIPLLFDSASQYTSNDAIQGCGKCGKCGQCGQCQQCAQCLKQARKSEELEIAAAHIKNNPELLDDILQKWDIDIGIAQHARGDVSK